MAGDFARLGDPPIRNGSPDASNWPIGATSSAIHLMLKSRFSLSFGLSWSYSIGLTMLVLLCWSVHWSTGPYAVNPTPAFGQKSKAPLMEQFHIELCNEPRPSLILCIKIDQNRSIMNRRTQCKSYIAATSAKQWPLTMLNNFNVEQQC